MTDQARQTLMTEAVNSFKSKEWFRNVAVYDAHPNSGEPTIEFKVNYRPIYELKEVASFALNRNIQHIFTIVDRNGKPVN